MHNSQVKLSIQDFKSRYSYQVFTNVMGKTFSNGKSILSPLREEKNPSFSIFKDDKSAEYLFKDFGSGESGDCIKFLMLMKNIEFKDAIVLLQQDFNCIITDDTHSQATLINRTTPATKSMESSKPYELKDRIKFNQQEADYFKQYKIKPDILKKFNVFALDSYTLPNGTNINRKENELIFCYKNEGWVKIYKPNQKYRFQYLGNKPPDFIFGYNELPVSGDLLILTGGEKDVLTLSSLGYNAISLNSETASFPKSKIDELKNRFKEIIVLYDIDETGLKASENLCKVNGFKQAILPDEILQKSGKDISDFIKQGYTIDDLKTVLDSAFIIDSGIQSNSILIVQPVNKWIEDSKLLPIPKMLFDSFWYEGEICILFADTNLGKSILAVQIGNSISKGERIYPFKLDALKQPVLYFDFELSQKQFEVRYSNDYQDHYHFENSFLRAEINPDSEIPSNFKDFESYLVFDIEQQIINTGVKILIIDNITYLRADNEKARNALPLMQQLKFIKKKYNLSILALAHTPKRDLTKQLSHNDLQGSKMLINFCDSSFAIGKSFQDSNLRYLKHIKTRSTEALYDTDNVCLCFINKESNFLAFEFQDYAKEKDHLKSMSDSQASELESNIIELKESNPYLTSREIALQLGTNHTKVNRVLRKNQSKSDLEQVEHLEQVVPTVPSVPK